MNMKKPSMSKSGQVIRNMRSKSVVKSAMVALMLACFMSIGQAQEDAANGLLVPEDLTLAKTKSVELEEVRVGGRLERLTVRRKNGVTDVYQNERGGALWSSGENELGDIQNTRQWKLGAW